MFSFAALDIYNTALLVGVEKVFLLVA